jgi:lysophospholipase L1-like esterase
MKFLKLIFCLTILSVSALCQHNGTIVGSPIFGAGKFNTALTGVDDSDYVSLPSPVLGFSAGSSWTVECWVKTTFSAGTSVFIGSSSSSDLWLGMNPSNTFYVFMNGFNSGAPFAFTPTTAINDGAWHHVALVMTSGTTINLFVDGTKTTTAQSGTAPTIAAGGCIGRLCVSGFSWRGAIDEVAMWSVAKYTSSFAPPSSPYVGTEANLLDLYHLDGNANDSFTTGSISASPATVVISTAGNVITLTGVGTAWTPGTPGSPTFTLSGGSGASITAQTVASTTSATITVTAGSALGTLTVTDPSTGATTTITVDPGSPTIISMNNAAILYSPFNWAISSSFAKTINSGAYLKVIFSGTSCLLTTDTSADVSLYPQLWIRIDNQAWTQFSLSAGNPTISAASSLPNRKHLMELVVKSTSLSTDRWTATQSIVAITSLVLDASSTVELPLRRTKNILIYGDSITEGLLTKGNPNTVDGADVLGAYSWGLTDAVDAEVGIVGFGGTGIVAGPFSGVPNLQGSYNLIYAGVSRSFTTPAPDLIIYNEGTNDGAGAGFITGYAVVINALLAAAPGAKQLVMVPFQGSHVGDIANVLINVGSTKVTSINTSGWFNPSDSVDGLHPYDYSGIGLIAPNLFPVVNALLYPSVGIAAALTFK